MSGIVKKAWWRGGTPTQGINEETSSSHSHDPCQTNQDHASRIALPLLAFFLLNALKLFDTGLQEAIFVKAWKISLSPSECLRQLRTTVEAICWLSMSLPLPWFS